MIKAVLDGVASEFRRVLAVRGASIEELTGDVAVVSYAKRRFEVSLDNLRRRVAGGEPLEVALAAFADLITAPADMVNVAAQPDGLRLMLEQLAVTSGHDLTVRPISERLGIVLVWTDAAESRVRFMGPRELDDWSLSEADAWAAAAA